MTSRGAGAPRSCFEATQPISRPEGDSFARYGHNMLPVNYTPANLNSPIFNYPYERSREALDTLYRTSAVDACHGIKLRYVNPANGGYPMPTMATFMQLLPKGFKGRAYRSTESTVYCVVEGQGRVQIGESTFGFDAHDVFVAPSWQSVRFDTESDAVVFSYSDRPVLDALGLLREERLPA